MKWCREHKRLTILVVTFLILLSLSVASFLDRGDVSWMGRQIQRVTTFLQEPITQTGDGFSSMIRGAFQWKDIIAENENLVEENKKLERDLIEQRLTRQELEELQSLAEALNYIDAQERHTFCTGTVIAADGSRWFRVVTINVGTEQGVHENAAVINADGLVGRVISVGKNWAKVVSAIDENSKVSFQVFRDPDLMGVLTGNGEGGLSGYLLEEDAKVVEGDLLVTSGMEIYSQGIPIGRITHVEWDANSLLRTVDVSPLVNFNNLRRVTVVMSSPLEAEE